MYQDILSKEEKQNPNNVSIMLPFELKRLGGIRI